MIVGFSRLKLLNHGNHKNHMNHSNFLPEVLNNNL